MSSALVRQALEFVDQEDNGNHKKREPGPKRREAEDYGHPYMRKNKKTDKKQKSKEETLEENIKKLLALSKPAAESKIAEEIIERAIKGKPLLETIKIKKAKQKSILFSDEED